MKKILYIFCVSLCALFVACEDEYSNVHEFSDVSWYTSEFRDKEFTAAIGNYISFADLSQGTVEHSWTINSGDYFLKGEISRNEKDLENFIDHSLDTVTVDPSAHVLFSQEGLREVTLRNVFEDSVTYHGYDTLAATYENGYWVIDTTFVVDVYDSIQPAFKVFQDDEEILNVTYDQIVSIKDSASWPSVDVESGTTLTFVDMTTKGRPETRTWNSGGGVPSNSSDSISEVSYMFLRTYYASISASRTSESIPSGYSQKYIPLKINVVPSSVPFEFLGTGCTENTDETIEFNVSGALDNFSGEEGNFVVTVKNTESNFDQVIPVKLAEANGDKIKLTLSESIYNTDDITIAYKGGNIVSVDERILSAFSAMPVTMYKPNALSHPAFGFENGDDTVWEKLWDNNSLWVGYSEEKAHSGTHSFKITANTAANKNAVASYGQMFVVPTDGTYVYSYWMYMDVPANPVALFTWLLKPDWSFSKNCWQSTSDFAVGEWVKVETEFDLSAVTGLVVQLRAPHTQEGSYYFDDFSLVLKETR